MQRALVSWVVLAAMSGLGCGGADGAPGAGGAATSMSATQASVTATSSSSGVATGATTGGGGAGAGGAGGAGGKDATLYPSPDWAVADPASVGIDVAALDAAATTADANESYCLLVIRHGKLVYERYFNGADAATTSPSWSIAKSYTSTLVGIALDRGDLGSLDDSASKYVPAWQDGKHEAIRIRDLVSMTSGLTWSAFDDYVTLAELSPDNTSHALGEGVSDPPGTKWTYDNAAVQALEAVFRGATGDTIEAYAKAHLWSKIGSTSASWKHDAAGHPTTYANVLATCRDHARLGYLYLHGGKWNDEQVVSSAWVASALTPSQSINRAYGFLWWLNGEAPAEDAMNAAWPGRMAPFAPKDLFAARGFGNQFVDVIPSLDLMVVRFGKDPLSGTLDLAGLMSDSHFGKHDAILAPLLDGVAP